MKSNLSIFSFIVSAFCVIVKKSAYFGAMSIFSYIEAYLKCVNHLELVIV